MRIFLTGGRGMVGRNVLEHPGARAHDWLAPDSSELDLRDSQAVLEWLRRNQPEMIVHAAGRVGGIQANMREPVRFLLDNLDMGRNLLWAARESGIRRVINLGSSCMYPRDAPNPLREEMLLCGELEPTNEAYALSKIVVARLCAYISQESPQYQYKTLIPCNIYGRFDKFDPEVSHMVPSILHKLHQAVLQGSSAVSVWGDGTARREFMFAGDLAGLILHAIDRFDELPPTMNVGLGHDWSVNDYYSVAARVVGYRGRFEHDLSKPVGMKRKLVCTARQQAFGWQATTSLEEGLAVTYTHYRESLKNE